MKSTEETVEFNLSGLTPGSSYDVEASPYSAYDNGVASATFNTAALPVITMSVSSTSSSDVSFTLTRTASYHTPGN